MPVSDNQLDLIYRYIDGDLSAAEEEQLTQQLQQNVELQQAFDQQILMHQFRLGELVAPVVSIATESADHFLNRVTGSMEAEQALVRVRPILTVKRGKVWVAVVAAVLVFILTIFIYFINQKNRNNPVVKLPGKDSIAK